MGPRFVRFLRLVALAWLAGACGAPPPPQASPPTTPRAELSRDGTPVERALEGGEVHPYRLRLKGGELAIVAAQQKGIDLEIRVEGRPLPAIDSPTGDRGVERAYLLAGRDGEMRLAVAAFSPQRPGRYRLRLETVRPADSGGRLRTRAEWTFARAEADRRTHAEPGLSRAVSGYRRALAYFSALDAPDREGDALDRLGRTLKELGDIPGFRAAYEGALDRFAEERRRGRPAPEREAAVADALNGRGLAERLLGDPERAARTFRQALAIQRRLGGLSDQGVSLNNLGRALSDRGDPEGAFAAYAEALAIWHKTGDEPNRGVTLANRGRLRLRLGDLEAARRDLLAACPLLSARARGAALANLAEALVLVGRRGEARPLLDSALALQRRTGDRRGEAITLGQLGLLAEAAGDLAGAARLERAAIERYLEGGDRAGEASSRILLGRIETRLGRPVPGIEQLAEALRLARAGRNRGAEAAALTGLARARLATGELAAAADRADEARAIVESQRRDLAPRDLRAAFLGSRRELWELSVAIAAARHRAEPGGGFDREAFALAETARARGLLEALEQPLGAARCPGPAKALDDLERALTAAGERALWLAENRATAAARDEAGAEVDRLLEERERLEAACRGRATPPDRGRMARPEPPAAPRLAPDAELIAFSLGEAGSYSWRLGRDRFEIRALPGRERIETLARRAHALVASAQPSLSRAASAAALRELSALLLGPEGPGGPGVAEGSPRRLIFVPEGALFYVPFAALPLPDGTPLIERAEVAVLPSVSALTALRAARAHRPTRGLALFADPVYAADDPRLAGRAASPAPGPARPLPRLPGTAREAAAILALVPERERSAALGFAAERAAVLDGRYSGFRHLHFAAHAVLDPERPALSAIALSGLDAAGRPRDGRLKAYEIQRLRLAADLVVLSGCETGLGRERAGEGLASLAQSFLIAGARATVQSLWRVDDEATADLMTGFYRGLLERREPPATALRAAQRALRSMPGRVDPRHWAGFVVFGDPGSGRGGR